MLEYDKFKEQLKEQLIHYMPLPFADGEVVFAVKEGNGVQKEGFYIKRQDNEEGLFMLLEPVYDKIYKNSCYGDLEKTMKKVSLLYEEQSKSYEKQLEPVVNDIFTVTTKDDKKNDFDILFDIRKVFFCVVNKESNKAYMSDIPHQDKGNLSMYLRLLVSDDGEKFNSIIIDRNVLCQIEEKGMDFNTLISYAAKNTPQLFPAQVSKMDDELYVISNESYLFGASTLFYPESPFQSIISNHDKDTIDNLIVIPCSNDFCIAFAAKTPAIADEEIYRQYHRAIKTYAKECGESALSPYPFVYNSRQQLLINESDILKDIPDIEEKEEKNGLGNDIYNDDENVKYNIDYNTNRRSL